MKISVMDRTGHSEQVFDTAVKTDLASAMARFAELTSGGGHIAASMLPGGQSRVLKAFDPSATEILFVPKLQGG